MDFRKPIFYDERQRRWRWTRRVLEIGAASFTLLLMIFFFNILQNPALPELLLPETRPALRALRERRRLKRLPQRPGRRRRVAALGKMPAGYDPLRAAFYVSWDSNSLATLQQHHRDIDLLIPEATHAISPDGRLTMEDQQKLEAWLTASRLELPVMSLVNNFDGSEWRIQELAHLLANRASRQLLISELVAYAARHRDQGIVVDFEEVPEKSQADFRQFAKDLSGVLHAVNLKLMVTLPAGNFVYDYAFFAAQADAIIVMDYDQHWTTSVPGPIAAQDWFVRNLQTMLQLIPREKLIVAVGNYAYDWTQRPRQNRPPSAETISFQQAMVTAQESEASIEFDPDSLNPHFSYEDEKNRPHQVWILDGVTGYNQLRAAERLGVRGTALWRLGSEDTSLWFIWDATRPNDSVRAQLEQIPPGPDLILEGDGDIWRITATPQKGQRAIRYDPASDMIVDESITTYPLSCRIDQLGDAPNKIAITFDDGPDPRFTPQILDILREKRVPATFFVTGLAANGAPDVLRRTYAEGNEVGNHTYTHSHFDEASATQLGFELKLTERLLESSLGVKTLLFRPPYGVDHQPESADEVALLPLAQSLGYIIVGARIDPRDWGELNGSPPPPAATIVSRVLAQAELRKGNIILLHDGGGTRSHTVEALPQIIDGLRGKGFELVSVSELLGQTRAQVMPPLSREERWLARADGFIFDLYHWLRWLIATVFVIGIGLVSARALIVGVLALVEKLRPCSPVDASFRPRVSVLIPAYNEEETIVETVRAALNSDYPLQEVIVVDDGSTDQTIERLREAFHYDPRLQVHRQPNRGKPAALDLALSKATGQIIITIDADTSIDPDAISMLMRHFADPRVAAVAGNVKVGNRNSWLTRWQALEYVTSQNLEKRAFHLLNCIPVVPGAVGAWRAEVVRDCGGLSPDTLAEDTDLTFTIRRREWRILYDEEAIGRTHAPESIGALIRQRFRWTFGTLQALWKHRDTLGRARYGTLGAIALPNIFLFQILLPLFSPVIDLLFLGSLVLWGLAHLHSSRIPQLWTGADVERSLIFFLGFMLIDLLTCVVAFALEKNEDWWLLSPLLLQRLYYRQMMYVVLFRSLTHAVQGRMVNWRGGLAEVQAPASPA
jgi:cellulose synthase/poly-beta-1,6-N-acetylglucosamine synthase-like glycosyltransferase/spore germination protein YaaH/peptidoglycan/xylan/chitin deacetylase (PgdA/CDA1 family)